MQDRVCKLIKMNPPRLSNAGVLYASGIAVPGAVAGYQTGAIFHKTDGGAGTSLYVNEGSETSASFQAIAALTAAQEALIGAVAGTWTASKAVIPNAQGSAGAGKFTSLAVGTSGSEVAITATPAQINGLAAVTGLAAVVSAGLGGSASYVKTDNGTKTLVAANADKDRGVLVVVHIDETFATGDTSQLILKIGETSTIEKCAAAAVFTNAAAGAVFCFGFVNTATKAILATLTAAAGTGTGAATISVIALPNS